MKDNVIIMPMLKIKQMKETEAKMPETTDREKCMKKILQYLIHEEEESYERNRTRYNRRNCR
jgi:hypothetical protein